MEKALLPASLVISRNHWAGGPLDTPKVRLLGVDTLKMAMDTTSKVYPEIARFSYRRQEG